LNNKLISIDSIDAFIFDFDGVMTNNSVYIDEDGREIVQCSRADGLAFDVLRKLRKPVYIVSTEINPVVKARAKKLNIPVLLGVSDKVLEVKKICLQQKYDLKKIFFIGNDVNDFQIMKICGYSACPVDSHIEIQNIASKVLNSRGGDGVVRELLENVIGLDFIKILYTK
jgi:3-deoxy-D-manno-octulosonate 8-phosphate phosphatase (KDO 8-P phosphatase)